MSLSSTGVNTVAMPVPTKQESQERKMPPKYRYPEKFVCRTICSALNCKHYQSSSDMSFHRFPKEPQRCAKWVQNLRNASLVGLSPERLHNNYRVCSAHFDDSQFKLRLDKRCGLTRDAVPTIIDAPNPPPPLDCEGNRKPRKARPELPRKPRKARACPPSEESTNVDGHHQGGDQCLKTKSRGLPSQEILGMASSTQHNGLDTDCRIKEESGGEMNEHAESQEDVSGGVPEMDEVSLDSSNARDRPVHQTPKRQTLEVDLSLTTPDPLPPSAGDIMALSDIFHSQLLLVIKELINAAQLEIAKVVISCSDRNVSMMTTEDDNPKLLHTHEGQKKDMILISSILEMFGREAVRKLNRVFTECCAALQNECKQSKQENNSLKRRIKDMQKRPNEKEMLLARQKAYSSSRCTQKDSHLTAPVAPSLPLRGRPPLKSRLLKSTDASQKHESLGMASSTQRNGLDTDCSLQEDLGGEINGYESQEDVSGGVPAMDEVSLDSSNARDRPVHQSPKRQTLVVELSLTPPDLFPPSAEQKSPHNEHLSETNQQTAEIKPEKRHSCDQCKKKYRHLKALLKHKVLHVHKYKCDICDKVYTNGSSLQSHKLVHLEVKPFTCSTCGRGFVLASHLKSHELIHTGERPYMCPTCGKRFTQAGSLKVHEKRHSGERPYMCDQCPKTFFTLPLLKKHNQVHTGEKPHKCDLCQKSFGQLANLRRHRLLHTGVKAFTCVVCLKGFTQKCTLKLHMQIHIEGEKPFKCEICGKAFVYKFALKNHMLKHDGNIVYRRGNPGNPVKCPVCGKCYSTPASLKIHTMVHSGQKPFKCQVCNKAFAQKTAYTQHTLIHTGEKPYKCSVCPKLFRMQQTLKKHMRIHTGEKPYKCQTCGLAFYSDGNLQRHIRVHTGEKPFSCDVCGKRFNQSNAVKAHMQIHTGERPHFCDGCGRRFGCHRTLKKHKCC